MHEERLKKIVEKKAKAAIIGLGYVGLPLAVELAKAGFDVTGIDVDKRKTDAINKGLSYIQDVPSAEVKELVKAGKLRATTDFSVLRHIDTINICVPTPLRKSKDPDISYILSATAEIAKYLHKGQLIILESTTYPGTTEEVMQPMLEKKGLKAGRDFHLAFSPERVDPGNPQFKTKNITKVVGGYTPHCTELAVALYSQAIDNVLPVSSTRVAETVKLLENTFRSINIGMVNEMAIICDKLGIDVWEVIDAAATKPFGFMPFYPGPGIGGHCLAADEYIFVKNDMGVQTIKIGDYVNNLSNSDSTLKHQLRDITLVKPQNAQTLSFDMQSKTFSYKDINIMSKRAYNGEMKRISTTDGRKITVTDKHPMLVHDAEGTIQIKLAQDIQPGDRLPLCSFWKETTENISKKFKRHDSFATVEVKAVDTMPGQDVYSMEVDDTNTFVSSYGIVTHNCIPLDPHYLSWRVRLEGYEARFIELAGQINRSMPEYVINKLNDALNDKGKSVKNAKILVLGVAYKNDIDDVRESPAIDFIKLLQKKGAKVNYHDPFIPNLGHEGINLKSVPLTESTVKSVDAVVIITRHKAIDYKWLVSKAKLVIDTRNATKSLGKRANVVKL